MIKLGPSTAGGIPILRSSDVRWLFIDANDIKHIDSRISTQYQRTVLRGGEVVVTVRGTLGGVAVVPSEMAGNNVSREVAVIPFESALNAEYLALAVAALPSQNWLAQRAKGVAYTGINIQDLKLLPLPIPPRNEQDEIVRRVRDLFCIADTIQGRVQSATQRSGLVEQAILTRAFRGELVPPEAELASQEGRLYESAGELLRRIGRADDQPNAARALHHPHGPGARATVGGGRRAR